MGICIHLEIIPKKIRPEDWHAVYQESLKIIGGFPFMDIGQVTKNGRTYTYGIRTKNRTGVFGRKCQGWRSVGDMIWGCNTEDYVLYDDIQEYFRVGDDGSVADDILTAWAEDGYRPECVSNVFGGKTQGERSHIPLLSIACMVEDRLPEGCAMVSGDINLAQCRQAAAWASQLLDKPVALPSVCRKEYLHRRFLAAGFKGKELVKKIIMTSLEGDTDLGAFLREKEPEGLYGYFRDELKNCDLKSMGMERITKRFLEMGGEFRTLCQMLVSDPEGKQLSLEEFLQMIVRIKLHVKEKQTYDFTRTDQQNPEKETVDGIEALLKRVFGGMFDMGNHNVDAYVPLEEIRDACMEVCGEIYDVDGIISRVLEQQAEKNKEESVQSMLYDGKLEDMAHEHANAKKELAEKYDVTDKDGLGAWYKGCRVEPKLEAWLLSLCKQLHGFSESRFGVFQAMGQRERENYFLERYDDYILLTDKMWDDIWANIMDDEYICRIHALWQVSTETQAGAEICRMMYRYPEMYKYYWEVTEIGGEGGQ